MEDYDTYTEEIPSDKQSILQSDDNDNSVISTPNSNEIIKDNEFNNNNNCETTIKTKEEEIQNEEVNNEKSEIMFVKDNESTSNLPDLEKCDICGQFLNNSDIIYYQGHPQDAVEEFIALTNEKLVLASGKIKSRLYLC